MSATNWATCPQCVMRMEHDKEHMIYQDFMNAWSSAEIQTTLREDYEIYVKEDGKFCVHYSCLCTVCGFSHKFEHSEQVKMEPIRDD